jgi:hypothetical protein
MADFAQRKGEAYISADTYGQKIKKSGWASFLKNVLNVKLDFVPVLRNVKAIYETLTDPVTIEKGANLELHFLKGIGLGLWHTVEGVVEMGKTIVTMTPPVQAYLWATQPEKQLAQWEARAYMMQHPLETLKAMGQSIYDEFDKRVIHGSEESRAEFAGEAVFNIASMFVGAGEVSLLAKASQGEKLAAQAARVEAKAEAAATRAVERAVGEGMGKNDIRMIKDTNGLRNELPLTENQKRELTEYAKKLGLPEENIRIAGPDDTSPTGLLFDTTLNINNDVLPSSAIGKLPANSKISGQGTIAHEVVGHYEAGLAGRSFQVMDEDFNIITRNFALDEAQASIRAARFAPDLTQAERIMLLRDGISRLRNQGIKIREVRDLLFIDHR